MRKPRRDALEDGQHEIAPDAVAHEEAAAAPVVGDEAEPLAARAADRGQARGRAVDLERRPTIFRLPGRAIERGQEFGAPGAHDAGEADDLAGAHGEAHVLGRLPAGRARPGREAGVLERAGRGLPNAVARCG